MKLQLTSNPQQKIFTGHGPGYVAINGERHETAVVVTAEAIHTDWPARDFASLEEHHFNYLIALQPEVILFGTGDKQQFAHPTLYRKLIEAGIAIEFMNTPAACRTYNILVAEDRKVIAAILP